MSPLLKHYFIAMLGDDTACSPPTSAASTSVDNKRLDLITVIETNRYSTATE